MNNEKSGNHSAALFELRKQRALSYKATGDYKTCCTLLEELYEDMWNADHREDATTVLGALLIAYKSLYNGDKIKMYSKMLEICRKVNGKNHPLTQLYAQHLDRQNNK